MADVGVGQLATTTGRHRSRKLKEAVKDAHPVTQAMDKHGGIRRIDGGRTIVEEALSGANNTVKWVGESGSVDVVDQKVADASEFEWKYQLGAVIYTLAEQYKNSGGSDTKLINLVASKFMALEATMENKFHSGVLSNGAGDGGLQLGGLAYLVSTTPTAGTVGTIDRSSADASWFRNQAFDTSSDWADGAVDSGNVKRFLDKGINSTMKNSKSQVQIGLLGDTHFEALTQALQALQVIQNESDTGHAGFQKLVYRGVPMYYADGINYSGEASMTATRTYLLNVKPGGVNIVYHNKAEFDMLEPVNAQDQAAVSRLMFTMANMTIGGLAKTCWVGF